MEKVAENPGDGGLSEVVGLGFFRAKGGRVEKADSDDTYSKVRVYRAERPLGEVYSYDEGFMRLGFTLPHSVFDLVGEDGVALVSRLSSRRKAEATDGIVISTRGRVDVAYTPDPQSFRNHVMSWREKGGAVRSADIKIPGEDFAHGVIEVSDFVSAVDIYHGFVSRGMEPPMACPMMLAGIDGEFPIRKYGGRDKSSGNGFPTNMLFREHIGGLRLSVGGRSPAGREDLVPEGKIVGIADAAGVEPGAIVVDAVRTLFSVSSMAHRSGYLLSDDQHWGNYSVCPDGRVRFVADTGSAMDLPGGVINDGCVMEEKKIAHMALGVMLGYGGLLGEPAEEKGLLEEYGFNPEGMRRALRWAAANMRNADEDNRRKALRILGA